jgi:hypothetical protein
MNAESKKELFWVALLATIAVFISIGELLYQHYLVELGVSERHSFTGFITEVKPYEPFLRGVLTYFLVIAITRYLLLGIGQLVKNNPVTGYFLLVVNSIGLLSLSPIVWLMVDSWLFPEKLLVGGQMVDISGGHRVWPPYGFLGIICLSHLFLFLLLIEVISIRAVSKAVKGLNK